MIVIGLTGGIASGKSTISKFLADLGAVVIDADKLGHQFLLNDSSVKVKLIKEFGKGILSDGQVVNRVKLGQIVFNDRGSLAKLNRIMHPVMYDNIQKTIKRLCREGVKVVVVEAAVFIEAKWHKLADEIWVTVIPEEIAVQRVINRSGLTQEEARARIRSQMSNKERCCEANVVIDTDCSIEEVKQKVEKLWEELLIREKQKGHRYDKGNTCKTVA